MVGVLGYFQKWGLRKIVQHRSMITVVFMAHLLGFHSAVARTQKNEEASGCNPQQDRPNSESKFHSIGFPAWESLPLQHQKLLVPYLNDLGISYLEWITDHDDHATSFFSVMQAHNLTELIIGNKGVVSASLIESIQEIHGDRMLVKMNRALFGAWKNAGGRFNLHRADGAIEEGKVNFNGGDSGGSLHCGYTHQGYTSVRKVPRLQWNYNEQTGVTDLDIDGYAPWVGGFLPNPKHLTWENSDVRYWYSSFQKKFGYAGFSTVLR